jgi:hypothetical protein
MVGIAENRQETVQNRQKAVKIPPTVAPISTKRLVLHPCHICELNTKFQVSSSNHSRDILVKYTENRQKAVKCFVSHPCHILQLHTKFQVSSSYLPFSRYFVYR